MSKTTIISDLTRLMLLLFNKILVVNNVLNQNLFLCLVLMKVFDLSFLKMLNDPVYDVCKCFGL